MLPLVAFNMVDIGIFGNIFKQQISKKSKLYGKIETALGH